MEIVIAVLYTVVVIVALLLIGLVLIQQSKTGGFGSTFGGVGESVFGAQAVNHLSKLTVILTTVFFILSLLLAAISGQRAEENRKVKAMNNELTVDAEAVKVENKSNSAEVEKKIEEEPAVPAKKQAE
ncbi:MAG: preprotein translocase subunit SecG [Victivallaceae bacterium]|nr:preprotein translocase subunit SecG [Victivallaceae bacterium]